MKFSISHNAHHDHDCDTCTFLGALVDKKDGTAFDIYHHPQGDSLSYEGGSIIARYGREGDYHSSPIKYLVNDQMNPDYILIRALALYNATK